MNLRKIIQWPIDATKQFFSNIWEVLLVASPEHVIPPWVWEQFWGTYNWLRMQFPRAAGYQSTPYEQMAASVVLAIAMVFVSIGTLTWVAPIMIFPFNIGFARLHPWVDNAWPLSDTTGPI